MTGFWIIVAGVGIVLIAGYVSIRAYWRMGEIEAEIRHQYEKEAQRKNDSDISTRPFSDDPLDRMRGKVQED